MTEDEKKARTKAKEEKRRKAKEEGLDDWDIDDGKKESDDTMQYYYVKIHARCDKTKETGITASKDGINECTSSFEFSAKEACPSDWDITKAVADAY